MISDNIIARWLMGWKRRKPETTGLPLGLSQQEMDALHALRATPQWAHYLRAIEKVAEQQASELASGLDHSRYLFTCGALVALRRVYTLVDDLAVSAAKLKEITDDRTRRTADADLRSSRAFLNTPWYDTWRRSGSGA